MSCECRKWRVVGATSGYCTYEKGGLTQKEANDFVQFARVEEKTWYYEWPDGSRFCGHGEMFTWSMEEPVLNLAKKEAQ